MLLVFAALLAGATPAAAPPVPPPAASPAEKVRCKRIEETGSLVRTRKECRTAREWDEISRNAQAEFGKFQGAGFSKGGGN